MEELVPIINHVLDSIERGQVEVSDAAEVRDALLLLRSLAQSRNDPTHSFLVQAHTAET